MSLKKPPIFVVLVHAVTHPLGHTVVCVMLVAMGADKLTPALILMSAVMEQQIVGRLVHTLV